jgi:hypothetical protein
MQGSSYESFASIDIEAINGVFTTSIHIKKYLMAFLNSRASNLLFHRGIYFGIIIISILLIDILDIVSSAVVLLVFCLKHFLASASSVNNLSI